MELATSRPKLTTEVLEGFGQIRTESSATWQRGIKASFGGRNGAGRG